MSSEDKEQRKEHRNQEPLRKIRYRRTLGTDDDDRSQAWCIVVCCFLVHVIVMGFLKCLGILTIELQKSFKATPSDVSVLVSITTCLNCVAGPLACYLVVKFTARTIAFTGTMLVALGLMLSWFATSITFLYITIGVFVGFGSGFTYSPGVILIQNYFQKKRGMANGVVVSGSPVGGMLMPYTLNFLIQYLDVRGALLILGGLMLNAVVCTLSYRPYQELRRRRSIIGADSGGQIGLWKARRTEGSIHIPEGKLNIRSSTSAGSCRKTMTPNYDSDSDDSSGPEFVNVASQSRIFNQTRKPDPTASSGSVIVYKINEKYGQTREHSANDGVAGMTRRRKLHKILSKPLLWGTMKPNKRTKILNVASGTNQAISGLGQNIRSKESQTEIRRKHLGNGVPDHPFVSNIRRSINVIDGGSVSSDIKVRQGSTSLTNNKFDHFNPVSSIIGDESNALGGSSMNSTARKRRNANKQTRKKDPPAPSTKKLSPYILSLDHSCVIMWSNDNVTKNQDLSTTVLKTSTAPKDFGDQMHPDSGENLRGSMPTKMQSDVEVLDSKNKKNCYSRFVSWIRTSPLSNPAYLILLFSNASTAISTTNILLLIPALGEYRGLSKAEYSIVHLLISLTDLCARLLGAFISDRGYLSSKAVFSTGLCLAGLSSLFIAYADDFLKMCLSGSLFGLACGLHVGIFGALLAEIVRIQLLHVGYAFCMILNGVLQLSFINISGILLSVNINAYTSLYIFYGIVLLFGGMLWIIPPILSKVRTLLSIKQKIDEEYQLETTDDKNDRG